MPKVLTEAQVAVDECGALALVARPQPADLLAALDRVAALARG